MRAVWDAKRFALSLPIEVSDRIHVDKCHKAVMQAKTQAIGGDLGRVLPFLERAMSWQGQVGVEAASKTQKKMSTQIVDVYWTAQQVAKSGVRTKQLQAEEK